MVEFIFTLDYEIYGNGQGSLRELVSEPTARLASIFKERECRFVVFAEVLEFMKIDAAGTDDGIREVRAQLRQFHSEGFEIGLHLHPWWFEAQRSDGAWQLAWNQRNLCAAAPDRINEVLRRAISYLRLVLEEPSFTPLAYRGGLWMMQPTPAIARALAQHGIQVDSSVFKGGRTRELGLDYLPSLKNGYHWRFSDDVNKPEEKGLLWEIPIHTEMVPFWKMLGRKRLGLQKKVPTAPNGTPLPRRWRDFLRLTYPRKLDFCRMSYGELQSATERVVAADQHSPEVPKMVVAIGHSKDLLDFNTIARFLEFLQHSEIPVTDFQRALPGLRRRRERSPRSIPAIT